MEQDEGDASLGSRSVSGGTCGSRRERLGTEESKAPFLGGEQKSRLWKEEVLGRNSAAEAQLVKEFQV